MTEQPCHVSDYAFATGRKVKFCDSIGHTEADHEGKPCSGIRGMYRRYAGTRRSGTSDGVGTWYVVPALSDPRWLSNVEIGLAQRHDIQLKIRFHKGWYVALVANSGMGRLISLDEDPNDLPSALCAAIAKAREAGNE